MIPKSPSVRPTTLPTPSATQPAAHVEWGTRSVDIFEKIEQVGEGTFGKVYKARDKVTKEIVALKKVRMDHERQGFPITAIREIKILRQLKHPNIIQLKEIVMSRASETNKGRGSVYMVCEYMDHDLTGLMDPDFHAGAKWFSQAQVKCYMKQLLKGLHYCHKNKVLHRDIKCSNLLINNLGELKLADFGLARPMSEHNSKYTNRVITLWYRPPELLLGEVNYGVEVDMWSVGCILAELVSKGRPIFPGHTEMDQLDKIFRMCGVPSKDNWPEACKLPLYNSFKLDRPYTRRIHQTFKDTWPAHALDLIDKLLQLDPRKRLSALDALQHEYFWSDPMPADPSELPHYPSSHEFTCKKRRQLAKQGAQQARAPVLAPPPALPAPSSAPLAGRAGAAFGAGAHIPRPVVKPPPVQSHDAQAQALRAQAQATLEMQQGRLAPPRPAPPPLPSDGGEPPQKRAK